MMDPHRGIRRRRYDPTWRMRKRVSRYCRGHLARHLEPDAFAAPAGPRASCWPQFTGALTKGLTPPTSSYFWTKPAASKSQVAPNSERLRTLGLSVLSIRQEADHAEAGFVRRCRSEFAGSAGYRGGADQDRVQQPRQRRQRGERPTVRVSGRDL